jgi:glycerophosphoryl diester phosphodiesterase
MTIPATPQMKQYDVRHIVQEIRNPKDDMFMIAAHRGLRWSGAPDNVSETLSCSYCMAMTDKQSRASVLRAARAGLACVEIDVQLTKDGVPSEYIASHSP